MPNIGKLIGGFRVFKSTTFERQKDTIKHLLAQGQKPSTLVISCADLRLSPAEILATNPGELYVLNNIGGLVPKFDTSGTHGILSAIEYAVNELQVENIVLLGHAKCDGIKMMMSDKFEASSGGLSESMKTWLSVASEARDAVKKEMSDKNEEEQQAACEHESLVVSMRNLMTYPYIAKRVKNDELSLIAWHFDVENGEIKAFDNQRAVFEPVS